MNITYEAALIDYMEKKGFVGIVIEQVSLVGCCADMVELYTRFVRRPEAQALREQGTWRIVGAPVGELFLAFGLETEDQVTLGIKNFLCVKDITYRGISAFSLRD